MFLSQKESVARLRKYHPSHLTAPLPFFDTRFYLSIPPASLVLSVSDFLFPNAPSLVATSAILAASSARARSPALHAHGTSGRASILCSKRRYMLPNARTKTYVQARRSSRYVSASPCTTPVQRQRILDKARQSWAAGSRASPGQDGESEGYSPSGSSSTVAESPAPYPQQFDAQQRKLVFGDLSTTATEGMLLTDNDGSTRWLGGTSGATFLDHLKKFMHTLKSSLGYNPNVTRSQFMESRGQYQTSDSRGMYKPPTVDSSNFPTNFETGKKASLHLAKVSEFLQGPTLSIHEQTQESSCGGIHYLGEFSYPLWLTLSKDPTRPELAFYEAAFALGTIYSLTAANSRRDGQLGEIFFANARQILGDPMDVSRYNMRDVATLAILGMYMSENNRRDTAYVYFSHAITICSMFGGLKGSSKELAEADKRIIWTLFCLTRDLSCLMGRPPHFSVEAFQLPPPVAVL